MICRSKVQWGTCGAFHKKWGIPNSWMIYKGKSQSRNGWELGVPLFQESPRYYGYWKRPFSSLIYPLTIVIFHSHVNVFSRVQHFFRIKLWRITLFSMVNQRPQFQGHGDSVILPRSSHSSHPFIRKTAPNHDPMGQKYVENPDQVSMVSLNGGV